MTSSTHVSASTFVPSRTSWTGVALVFWFALFANMSTSTLGIITPGLVKGAHLTPVQIGAIATTMTWLSIPTAFLASWLADVLGPRFVGTGSTVIAAITNVVFPLSGGFGGFLLNRIVFTMGGVWGNGGIGNRLLAGTTSEHRRGLAASLLNITFPVGTLLLVTVGTEVISLSDWRVWMYVLGGVGMVVAAVWAYVTRGARFKAGPRSASAPENGGTEPAQAKIGLLEVFQSRTLLGIGLGWGFSAWSFLFLVNWLPLYFVQARHLPFREAGFASVAPWVGGMIAGLATGVVSDAILKRTGSYRIARTYLAVGGQFVFVVCLALTALSPSLPAVFALLFLAEFANQVSACMFQVVPLDTAPYAAGSATSYVHMLTSFVGAFSGLAAGALFQVHLYNVAFLIAAAFPLVGGLIMLVSVYPGDLRKWGEKSTSQPPSAAE